MVRRVNLMLGGPKALLPDSWRQVPGIWGGADRGSLFLLQNHVQPIFAVGDYDSVTPEEKQQVLQQLVNVRTYPPEKDYTDTQLCLMRAIRDFGATDVYLYAATGGRMDHLLANMLLATEPRFAGVHLHIIDRTNDIVFMHPGTHRLHEKVGYRYLGVVPLTAVRDLNINGAKYPLHHWNSDLPFSWASNEFLPNQDVTICFAAGTVAVIYSRDRNGQQAEN